jgi:hypothetical protein
MELQYASDLHIDHYAGADYATMLTPVAPVLLLAGDLCSAWKPEYAAFLRWCSTNVVFLQNGDSVLVPGTSLRIVGATLWSAVDPAIHGTILSRGDYQHTYTATPQGIRKTLPMDIVALHALQKAHLQSALASFPEDKLVLMTHHLPSFSLQDEGHRGKMYSSCYASADDDLFYHANLAVVLCGHSHRAIQVRLPTGARAVMNARGYPKEVGRWAEPYSSSATIRG